MESGHVQLIMITESYSNLPKIQNLEKRKFYL